MDPEEQAVINTLELSEQEDGIYGSREASPRIEGAGRPIAQGHASSGYVLFSSGAVLPIRRVQGDVIWHFYEGGPLEVTVFDEFGGVEVHLLGRDLARGERRQLTVLARQFHAARAVGRYALVGRTVAPSTGWAAVEVPSRDELGARFPDQREILDRLARTGPHQDVAVKTSATPPRTELSAQGREMARLLGFLFQAFDYPLSFLDARAPGHTWLLDADERAKMLALARILKLALLAYVNDDAALIESGRDAHASLAGDELKAAQFRTFDEVNGARVLRLARGDVLSSGASKTARANGLRELRDAINARLDAAHGRLSGQPTVEAFQAEGLAVAAHVMALVVTNVGAAPLLARSPRRPGSWNSALMRLGKIIGNMLEDVKRAKQGEAIAKRALASLGVRETKHLFSFDAKANARRKREERSGPDLPKGS